MTAFADLARRIHHFPLEHYNDRPVCEVDTLVIHSMHALASGKEFDPLTCFAGLDSNKVSAHFTIDREGEIWQHVDPAKRAWHAGVSKMPQEFGNRENVNDFSIGVELIAFIDGDFTDAQYNSLVALTSALTDIYPLRYTVKHSTIAIPHGRKTDPGTGFDWNRFEREFKTSTTKPNLLFDRVSF